MYVLEINPKPDRVRVDFGGFVLFHHVYTADGGRPA